MSYTATIGKYYATSLQYINDAGKSEYYVAAPNEQMDCATLQAGYSTLETQIAMWNDRLMSSTKAKEQGNIQAIIDIQSAKQAAYQELIDQKCGIGQQHETTPTETGNGPAPKPTPTEPAGNSTLLMVGIAALAIILLMRK